jgi:hypothetical protein
MWKKRSKNRLNIGILNLFQLSFDFNQFSFLIIDFLCVFTTSILNNLLYLLNFNSAKTSSFEKMSNLNNHETLEVVCSNPEKNINVEHKSVICNSEKIIL